MLLQEPRDDVGAERERDTTVVFAPARNVLVGVGPEEITEKATVGDLAESVQSSTGAPSKHSRREETISRASSGNVRLWGA